MHLRTPPSPPIFKNIFQIADFIVTVNSQSCGQFQRDNYSPLKFSILTGYDSILCNPKLLLNIYYKFIYLNHHNWKESLEIS